MFDCKDVVGTCKVNQRPLPIIAKSIDMGMRTGAQAQCFKFSVHHAVSRLLAAFNCQFLGPWTFENHEVRFKSV